MASARRNNEDAPLSKSEQERLANIARNREMLASLNIPCMREVQHDQTRKRTKVLSKDCY